jgi:hypothetical protein
MLERLAQLLYPGMIAVKPAYGVIQVRSSEPTAILYPDAQFVYRPAGNDRKRDSQNADLYFSPSHASKIVDGSIQYIVSGRELFQIEEGVQKLMVASSSKGFPFSLIGLTSRRVVTGTSTCPTLTGF